MAHTDMFICGPWCGEFGWEVATWVPVCRYKSQKHKYTIVVCQPGHEDLYEFADKVFVHNIRGKPDRWLCGGKKPKLSKKLRERYPNATVWQPKGDLCYNKPRSYLRLGEYKEKYGIETDIKFDIVIHARNVTKYGQEHLNWKKKHWEEFVEHFNGKRMAVIGSQDGALSLAGCVDYRGVRLGAVCNMLANSGVCVGTSSGPMHLASFCSCPHVVFTYAKALKSLKGRNNRWRYERWWNPFKTPVIVIDEHGWQPPVKAVTRAVEKIIGCT